MQEECDMEKVRVVLYGIGAIGSRIGRFLLGKEGVEVVAAIDAKDKVGRDLGVILGLDKHLGIHVSGDPESVFSKVKADIVIHATTSFLEEAYPQIARALEHEVNVVSTCEELAYPYTAEPVLAQKLDELAKERGATVLGTGINPGFIMDTLAITLTGVCQEVERIRVTRRINATTRRAQFQKKIGAGLSVEEFEDRIERKIVTGHVGLEQSVSMIANALGWELDEIEIDPVEPVVAKTLVKSEAIRVNPGQVAGLRQRSRGVSGGRELITLEIQAFIGAEQEHDSVSIQGTPNFCAKISPCIHGDVGTVAIVVNSIPKVLKAPPGLVTMKDLPAPSAVLDDMRKYLHQ